MDVLYINSAGVYRGGYALWLEVGEQFRAFATGHVEFYGNTTDNPVFPIEYERGAFFKLTWMN